VLPWRYFGVTYGTLHHETVATELRQLIAHGENEIEVGMEGALDITPGGEVCVEC
jgi:hypothetical protein